MPGKRNEVSPTGVLHSPSRISNCCANRSKRSRISGSSIPVAACSRAHHPAPKPSSTRPPLIESTCAPDTASSDGCRNVAEVIRLPKQIVTVSRPSATNVIRVSLGPGSPSPSPAIKWSERKKPDAARRITQDVALSVFRAAQSARLHGNQDAWFRSASPRRAGRPEPRVGALLRCHQLGDVSGSLRAAPAGREIVARSGREAGYRVGCDEAVGP